jgi:hypothetical protein
MRDHSARVVDVRAARHSDQAAAGALAQSAAQRTHQTDPTDAGVCVFSVCVSACVFSFFRANVDVFTRVCGYNRT